MRNTAAVRFVTLLSVMKCVENYYTPSVNRREPCYTSRHGSRASPGLNILVTDDEQPVNVVAVMHVYAIV